MWAVKEYRNDGYEDWCVNSTEFVTETEADKFADEVYDPFGYNSMTSQRVVVEFEA